MSVWIAVGVLSVLAIHFLYSWDPDHPFYTLLLKENLQLQLFTFSMIALSGTLLVIHNKEYGQRIAEVKLFI